MLLLLPGNDDAARIRIQLWRTNEPFGLDRIGQCSYDGLLNVAAADAAAATLVECQRQLGQTVLAVQIIGRIARWVVARYDGIAGEIGGPDLEAGIKIAQLVAVARQNAGR